MIKYLLKNTAEYRIDDIEDVKKFHEQLQEQAKEGGYTLNSFSWSEKSSKLDGDIEIYFVVKATFIFNVAKDPENYQFTRVDFPEFALKED
jgi:hypothetical protein